MSAVTQWTQPAKKRTLHPPVQTGVQGIRVAAALYIMYAELTYPEPLLHRVIAFGLFFATIFLAYQTGFESRPVDSGAPSPATAHAQRFWRSIPLHDWLLSVAALVVSGYVVYHSERFLRRMLFVDPVTIWDTIFFILTILLILEGTRRVVGVWLPLLSALSLLYLIYGHRIPGLLGHKEFTPAYIVESLFMTTFGIWSNTLAPVTGVITIFMIFSSFFLASGAGDFLFEFAALLTASRRAGFAKVAILASALFGMISGGPVTNVSTTGALTINAMKKRGYPADFAASVESCASAGGTIMPPIMGSVVFVMSETIGLSYAHIAGHAMIPALLFYTSLFIFVDLRVRRFTLPVQSAAVTQNIWGLLQRSLGFLLPVVWMTARLLRGIAPSRAGFEVIALILIYGFATRKFPFRLSFLFSQLAGAISRNLPIFSAMVACSVFISIINITGLGMKISTILLRVSGQNLLLTLVMTMLITLFLGMPMDTTSAYLITAVICAPPLVGMGLPILAVHLFILFFAALSTITPPVALTAVTASAIAEVDRPTRVAWLATRMSFATYLIPYALIFSPALLLTGHWTGTVVALTFTLAGIVLVNLSLEGIPKLSGYRSKLLQLPLFLLALVAIYSLRLL